MSSWWPWLTIAGLGAFHGINPAMGWLFAVALGLHRRSMGALLAALPAIALGHALSIGIVAGIALTAGRVIDPVVIQGLAGAALIGWAGYHYFYGHRHRVRVGMQTGLAGLILWSFLMATAHGAGLMLLPALMPLCLSGSATAAAAGDSAVLAMLAVALHTGVMLAVTAAIAVCVYRWVGLAVLRSAWINLDLLWSVALLGSGVLLIATA